MSKLRKLQLYESRSTLSGVVHLYTVLQGRSLDEVWEAVASTERDEAGQVVSLDLSKIRVTDAGLVHLKGLKRLQFLFLNGTQVTDAGLAHLEGLANLNLIDLTGTQVTDAGLDNLRGLSNLRTLHLAGTKVTREGVKKLQQASSGRIRVQLVDFSHLKSDVLSPKSASSYVNLASALMNQGRTEKAEALFSRALEYQPSRKEAHLGLAMILDRQRKPEEAAARYQQALGIDPSYFEAHMGLGLLLVNVGRLDEGREHLADSVRLKPKDPSANYYYGHVLHRLGKPEEAAVHYQRALRYDPELVTALLALAAIHISADRPDLHNPAEAVTCAEKACELTEHADPGALEILAKIYAAAGRLDDAVRTAKHALKAARNTPDRALADRIEKDLAAYQRILIERQNP
ncbi:MAG: hypothetical protein A2V98_25770 [Planctomycetes bacterium RBG_16_64_12]|nr:MAG: hypothetical protein A2V98_25770 [Planctomycetes bacterium RBG_16_64_12]